MSPRLKTTLLLALLASACAADNDAPDDEAESEIISRVVLTFTPTGGGSPFAFEFNDPDGDGGVSGTADAIELPAEQSFALDVGFVNTIADPPEEITEEIREEAEDHFVFVLGEGVAGPAATSSAPVLTHAYDDVESDYGDNAVGDDLPVGLRNTIDTNTVGNGTMRIVLRHLPELNGSAQKTGDLPEALAAGETLPGSVDVDVSFALAVN
ncbi:MAG: hypothetical protein IAG13_20145 [Deltaproteobacteria bacterium]|nr:hypothetical protein [Nannocystaceae bacterium]